MAYNETPTLKGYVMNEKTSRLKNAIRTHKPEIIAGTATVAAATLYLFYSIGVKEGKRSADNKLTQILSDFPEGKIRFAVLKNGFFHIADTAEEL